MTRSVLVTGASAGIGLETARALSKTFDLVGIVGRNEERLAQTKAELAGNRANIISFRADFASLEQVGQLVGEIKASFDHLDVLVNNAGLWHSDRQLSQDGFEETFAVNHLAPFALTLGVVPLLEAADGARVVNVSSRLHINAKRGIQFDDIGFEKKYAGLKVYGHSKLANILFSNELARRVANKNITSNSVHPGGVATSITRDSKLLKWLNDYIARPFLLTAAQGAQTSIYVATSAALEGVTGKYFANSKEAVTSKHALDQDMAARLWRLSEDMTGARL